MDERGGSVLIDEHLIDEQRVLAWPQTAD
jgi:hypothetical protein